MAHRLRNLVSISIRPNAPLEVKMFELTSRNRVVLLKRLEHFDVRSMVDKSTDHGNEFINVLQ